jgi:REP element-mobilizing transposase RayT
MVTFRLSDALPAAVLEELRADTSLRTDAERREHAEAYLDASHGACYPRDPAVAALVQKALLHFDSERYRLLAWSVMPNHVHTLIKVLPASGLAQVLHGWKSLTAHEANRMLDRSGAFWQKEHWDRYIRDEEHFANAVRYIHERNRSPFSSAAFRVESPREGGASAEESRY